MCGYVSLNKRVSDRGCGSNPARLPLHCVCVTPGRTKPVGAAATLPGFPDQQVRQSGTSCTVLYWTVLYCTVLYSTSLGFCGTHSCCLLLLVYWPCSLTGVVPVS